MRRVCQGATKGDTMPHRPAARSWGAAALALALITTSCAEADTNTDAGGDLPTASPSAVPEPTPPPTPIPGESEFVAGPFREIPADEGWTAMAASPRDGEPWDVAHAVWTGTELVVVGRYRAFDGSSDQLLAYGPDTDAWRVVGDRGSAARSAASAVWTGQEIVVLGGWPIEEYDPDIPPTPPTVDGVAYDAVDGSPRAIPEAPLAPRWGFSATWTGDEVVVWGGFAPQVDSPDGISRTDTFADGAAWNPATNTWRTIAPSPLAPRGLHGAVWNGRRLVVFGGGDTTTFESEFFIEEDLHDAAVYDPATDTWATIESPPEIGTVVATAWTGRDILYWTGHLGDDRPGNWRGAGHVWEPVAGDWRELAPPPFDARRDGDVASVWAEELGRWVVWGGGCGEGCNRSFREGALFDPSTDTWERLPSPGTLVGVGSLAAWTGDRLLVVGGAPAMDQDPERHYTAGARFSPELD